MGWPTLTEINRIAGPAAAQTHRKGGAAGVLPRPCWLLPSIFPHFSVSSQVLLPGTRDAGRGWWHEGARVRSRDGATQGRGVRLTPACCYVAVRHGSRRPGRTPAPRAKRRFIGETNAYRRHRDRQEPARGRQRHHRGADRRRADQVRDGQGAGTLVVDRFLYTPMRYPGQLRLRPAHAVARTATRSTCWSPIPARSSRAR